MENPGVSIIICTHNGKARLASSLDAILTLDQSIDFELILVDNASTDGTEEFAKGYVESWGDKIKFRCISEQKQGLLFARIAGIKVAGFSILLFCDDDNSLFKDYLQVGFQIMEDNPAIGVLGGMGIAKSEAPFPDWFSTYQKSYAVGPQASRSGIINDSRAFVYGAGSFYRKEPLLKLLQSGFQPVLTGRIGTELISGDDVEWCWLLKLMGYKIAYEEKLKFYHFLSSSRIDKAYYINLKKGIAAGAALLFVYEIFWNRKNLSEFKFQLTYHFETIKVSLRVAKNEWLTKRNKNVWLNRLGLEILKSKKQSFLINQDLARRHYLNLQKSFSTSQK